MGFSRVGGAGLASASLMADVGGLGRVAAAFDLCGWLQFAATGKYVGTTEVRDAVAKGTWAALHNSQLAPPPHAALATNVTTTGTTSPLVPFREAS